MASGKNSLGMSKHRTSGHATKSPRFKFQLQLELKKRDKKKKKGNKKYSSIKELFKAK